MNHYSILHEWVTLDLNTTVSLLFRPGLDGSYHPESDGTLMGAAMSVAKNVASNSPANSMVTPSGGTNTATSTMTNKGSSAENGPLSTTNGDTPKPEVMPEEPKPQVDASAESNGGTYTVLAAAAPEKPAPKVESSVGRGVRKTSFGITFSGGSNHRQPSETRTVADRRQSGSGNWAVGDRLPNVKAGLPAPDGASPMAQVSPDVSVSDKHRSRKKSSEFAMDMNRLKLSALVTIAVKIYIPWLPLFDCQQYAADC